MARAIVATLTLILLFALPVKPWQTGLPGSIFSSHPAAASPEEVKWSRVNIPDEGEGGNWALASGSDIKHLAMAKDGTLYATPIHREQATTLFKSTDAGYSWSASGQVKNEIAALTTAPDNAGIVYYATGANVYKSTDAGASFELWGREIGGAGSTNITITSLTVTRQESHYLVAVGTKDSDSSQYGGVYTLEESGLLPGWQDSNIGNYDVLSLAFSPNFASDHQLIAVVTDESDTLVISRIGDGNWGSVIASATIEMAATGAVIAFPDDYDGASETTAFFIGIDSGVDQGDVYRVNPGRNPDPSSVTDLDIGDDYNLISIDISGLAISGPTGTAILLAGAADSSRVYISSDSGKSWQRSRKEPMGESVTIVITSPDFTNDRRAYAATSGTESGFSFTDDGGVTWHQTGLIDTRISSIVGLAIPPDYQSDDTLFLLTFDGTNLEYSLWRSLEGKTKWQRTFTSTPSSVDSINLAELPPGYGNDNQVVFLAGTGSGNPAIWKSTDNGLTFSYRSAPASVDVWTLINDNSLFLGSYNGSGSLVYRTDDGGFSYSTGVQVGSLPLESISLSPDYEQDGAILIGNSSGWVYYSSNNATSFEPLPPDAASPPLTGEISVAFDSEFASNKTVYAVSSSADKGVYRFIINRSTEWERIDSTLPAGGTLSQLAVSGDGTLYATSTQSVDTTNGEGGMERSLNPTYSLGPTFETVTRGLDDGAALSGLWLRDNQLWSIDTQNTRLVTYADSLAQPITLTSPTDKAPGIDTENVILNWETLPGATEYKWQLDYDTDFSAVPADFEAETKASSARLPELEMGSTYYWRVRATEPVLSRWSAKQSFTTTLGTLGTRVIAPELYYPEAGASEVSVKPLFQWSALTGADSYELMVSIYPSFSNPTILKIDDYALPATAWQSNINLDYNTTYYWKVRAISPSSSSAWSAVGIFTTELPAVKQPSLQEPLTTPPSLPQSPPPPSPPSSPTPAQTVFPDWALYLGGALLLVIVILLVTLLMLVATLRHRD
ncbi:MAG: hypothetical protein Q8O55_12355 [Dehalococcoidales bacterium]|nr:hypothetical protein [Dehalococcoidales bacterium]